MCLLEPAAAESARPAQSCIPVPGRVHHIGRTLNIQPIMEVDCVYSKLC